MDFDMCHTKQSETGREELLEILDSNEPIWTDKHHPELAEGTDAWMRKLRREDEQLIDDWYQRVGATPNPNL